MRLLYTFALFLLLPWALLHLWLRARRQPAYLEHVSERFGLSYEHPGTPLIWLHAVSVGETRAAEPLIKALRQRHSSLRILLTHTTPTGRQTSVELFGDGVSRCYLPYDFPFAVKRFLRHFRPQVGIVMETEIWPNLIEHCQRGGIPVYLVNARMSEKSYPEPRCANSPGSALRPNAMPRGSPNLVPELSKSPAISNSIARRHRKCWHWGRGFASCSVTAKYFSQPAPAKEKRR